MPPIIFPLSSDQGYWADLTYYSLKGKGYIQPTLYFTFRAQGRAKEAIVHILQSNISLFLGEEFLGKGELIEAAPRLYSPVPDTQLTYEVLVSRSAIDYVHKHFRDYALPLEVEIQGLLIVQFETQQASAPVVPLGQAWENQWKLISLKPIKVTIHVDQGSWIKEVLNPLGINEYILIEMPLPPMPERERWEQALNHLKTAEERYVGGDDAGVLASCFSAFEAVAINGDVKRIFDRVADPEKREKVDRLFVAAKTYFHSGRHIVKVGEQQGTFAADHRDAVFALGLARIFIAYTAQLLVGST